MELEVTKKIDIQVDVKKDLCRLELTQNLHSKMKKIVYGERSEQNIQELYDYLKTLKTEQDILFAEAFIVGYMGITQFFNEVVSPMIDYLKKALQP